MKTKEKETALCRLYSCIRVLFLFRYCWFQGKDMLSDKPRKAEKSENVISQIRSRLALEGNSLCSDMKLNQPRVQLN